MTCWGCYNLTVTRRCMGHLNLISCLFNFLLFLVRVPLTRNTGKFSFLFCVLALCSLISDHVLLYYWSGEVPFFLFISLYFDRASNAPSQIRLVSNREADWNLSLSGVQPRAYFYAQRLTRFVRQEIVFQISLADSLYEKFTESINFPRTKVNLKQVSINICTSNNSIQSLKDQHDPFDKNMY